MLSIINGHLQSSRCSSVSGNFQKSQSCGCLSAEVIFAEGKIRKTAKEIQVHEILHPPIQKPKFSQSCHYYLFTR
jgi:hypothetical protein